MELFLLFMLSLTGLALVVRFDKIETKTEWKDHLPSFTQPGLKPLLMRELKFKASDRPFVWQRDLGRRFLSVDLSDGAEKAGFSIPFELEVRIPGAPGIGPNHPIDHDHARIPFQGGFIICSGASKAVALRLGRLELEKPVQQLVGAFIEGNIPQFQLKNGWLRWTVPGKLTAEKHEALLNDAMKLALALEDALGESEPMDLLEVVLTRNGELQAQALDTLLSDFSDTKEAKTARNFANNSADDVLQLIGELDKAEPAIGLILELLAGEDIPVWLEARAKIQLQGQEVGGLMLIQPDEAGKLSVSEDVEGALSKPMRSKEAIQ